MFFACEIWCVADVSSVSPSSEQTEALPEMECTSYQSWSGPDGPAHGSEPLNSPHLVGQSAGIWELWRDNVRMRLDWSEPDLLFLTRFVTGPFLRNFIAR